MDTQNSEFSAMGSGRDTYNSAARFPNPFCDIASVYWPSDITEAFEYCEYLYMQNGTYRAAARRVVRYFLTEIEVEGGDDDGRERMTNLLENKLGIMDRMAEIGDDYSVYGNVFLTIFFPFDRLLTCPECRTTYNAKKFNYKFNLSKLQFSGHCRKCDYKGVFNRSDVRSLDTDRLKLIRRNPKRIKIRVHPESDRHEYYYEPEPRFLQRVQEGSRFHIDDTPWDFLRCCAAFGSGQVPLYKFKDDAIFHLRETTLSGVKIKGWAIPPILPNFKLAYYIQILRRHDEAIALDHIVPFRIFHPGNSMPNGQMDGMMQVQGQAFAGNIATMIAKHRRDPTAIQVAPHHLGYMTAGSGGTQMAPKELIELATDELLNASGFPAQLYRGDLSIQAFPTALRLFEKTWGNLVDGNNEILSWLSRRICRYFGWEPYAASMLSVTLADDIERNMLLIQAAAGRDISKGTAYKAYNIDYMEEQRKALEEETEIQRLQQEAMEEAEAAQMYEGGGEEGGQPMDGATPGDLHQQAQEIAYQLVVMTPENLRRGELQKIKRSNETLHALVIQAMDQVRNEMSRQGQAMVMEQAKMGSVNTAEISPFALGLLVTSAASSYTRADMRKVARHLKTPGVRQALGFIWRKVMSYE